MRFCLQFELLIVLWELIWTKWTKQGQKLAEYENMASSKQICTIFNVYYLYTAISLIENKLSKLSSDNTINTFVYCEL